MKQKIEPMKEETGYFSSFDGTKLFYRAWEKESPNAIILVHGFGEHSGRYWEFIELLDSVPCSFFIHDLRGHGHSEGKRVYLDTFKDFTEDVYAFRNFIEQKRAAKIRRFVLIGQSLGGLIVTSAVLKNQAAWNALILLSPFFAMATLHRPAAWLAWFLNVLVPKMIWNNPIRPAYLTHDLEQLALYQRDTLIQRKITARLANEMFCACSAVEARAKEITIPFFIFASGDDRIVSCHSSQNIFEKVNSTTKRFQIFEDFYHELIHERERSKPIAAVKDCLVNLTTGLSQ